MGTGGRVVSEDNALIDVLRARLAEDEAAAQAAAEDDGPEWAPYGIGLDPQNECCAVDGGGDTAVGIRMGDAPARHIARHDPARVLREVAAIRDVLACVEQLDAKLLEEGRHYLTSYTYGVLESLSDIWGEQDEAAGGTGQ